MVFHLPEARANNFIGAGVIGTLFIYHLVPYGTTLHKVCLTYFLLTTDQQSCLTVLVSRHLSYNT